MPQIADPIPLSLQLSEGETNRYARAKVFAPDGSEISGSPFNLTHVSNGLYQTEQARMPDELFVVALYQVFTDSGYTTPDTNYAFLTETFEKTVLATAPAAEIVTDITGAVSEENEILGGTIDD